MKKLMSKSLLSALIGSAVLLPTTVLADVSANVGVTTNYLWRGIEQADGGPAISGGFDYSNESGFYAGTWASNVDFADADVELDLYGGYTGKAGDWDYDVGYILFMYPGTDADLDFGEIYGNFSKGALTLGVAVLANADGADFGDSVYLSADYGIPLANDFEVGLHVGSYTGDFVGDDDLFDVGVTVGKDAWVIGVSKLNEGDDDVKLYASYSLEFEL